LSPIQIILFAWPARSDSRSNVSTKSTSQSAQCVNPRRYSALHSGQNITAGVYYTKVIALARNMPEDASAAQCALPLFFLFAKSFEGCRKLFHFEYCVCYLTHYDFYVISCRDPQHRSMPGSTIPSGAENPSSQTSFFSTLTNRDLLSSL
jgi:hypothetical protein